MNDWLTIIALHVIAVIHGMALLIVTFGSAQAFVRSIRAMVSPSATGRHFYAAYVQYAR